MKKLLFFSLLLFGFLSFSVASASMTFNPVSPQVWTTEVFTTCSVGNNWYLYTPSEGVLGFSICTIIPFTGVSGTYGAYIVAECDNTATSTACGSGDLTLAEVRLDPGFISETTYTFTATPPAPGTPIIQVPGGFVASLLAYAGRLFTDLELLIALAIGLPVAFFVIRRAIGLIKKRLK
jgi:hypothetical protein